MKISRFIKFNKILILVSLAGGYTGTVSAAQQKLTVSPSFVSLTTGNKIKLNINGTGLKNTAVKWSYNGCGWIQKSTGVYHAPKGMRTNQTVCFAKITATSIENPSLSSVVTAKVSLNSNSTSVTTPQDDNNKSIAINQAAFNLDSGQKRALSISTVGLDSNAVKWSFSGCGWMEKAKGIYHAPNGMPSGQTVCQSVVKATSVEYPSLTSTTEVTVTLSGNREVAVVQPKPVVETTVKSAPVVENKPVQTTSNEERIWLHPAFKRKGDGELANFNFMANSKSINYYGMRYELPWSLFEKSQGQYDFSVLDKVMKNAKERDFKVYIVLHDKTWYYGNAITNTWPVPGNSKNNSTYFTTESNGKSHTVRVAKRWNPDVEKWYLSALEALLKRRTVKSDYSQLEVVSFGESSLSIGTRYISRLTNMGYPGEAWYKDYLIRLLQSSTALSNQYYTNQGAVKIAMNLNWIPGQTKPGVNGKWMQHEVLEAIKHSTNAVQAIEDVHANGKSPLYKDRIYKYTLDNKERVVSRDKVWAHISCDTKHDGQSAAASLAMARSLGNNITIRHRCDASSSFSQYESLMK